MGIAGGGFSDLYNGATSCVTYSTAPQQYAMDCKLIARQQQMAALAALPPAMAKESNEVNNKKLLLLEDEL